MHSHNYDSIIQAQAGVRANGFTEEYLWKDEEMRSEDGKKVYKPSDFTIVEHYRFEGDSNPGDMSILMALHSRDGKKGYVVSSYGPYADDKLMKFLDEVTSDEGTDVQKHP